MCRMRRDYLVRWKMYLRLGCNFQLGGKLESLDDQFEFIATIPLHARAINDNHFEFLETLSS